MRFGLTFAALLAFATLAKGDEWSAAGGFLSPADRITLGTGGLVAKVVETDDRTEVLSVAAIRAPFDLDRLLDKARTPLGFHRAEDSLGEGRLGSPPSVADFSTLHLDARDLELLSSCRVGDCRVRLTAEAIRQLHDRVDWSAPDRHQAVERAFRGMLVSEAAAYLARGHSGLTAYGDGPSGVHRAEGLTELLKRPFYLLEGAPDLADYMQSFPSARPRLVDEFLSWRQDKFWRRPVIGLYHTMIWEASNGRERRILVASKQFYASHFYESAVDLLEVRKSELGGEAEVAFVSRVRADVRPAGFNWLERVLLRRLVRGRLEDEFESLRTRLARTAMAEPASPAVAFGSGVRPRESSPPRAAGTGETRTRAGGGSPEGKLGRQ